MSTAQAHQRDGYVHLPQFLPTPVANSFLAQLKGDFDEMQVDWKWLEKDQPLLARPALQAEP